MKSFIKIEIPKGKLPYLPIYDPETDTITIKLYNDDPDKDKRKKI